MRPAKRLTLGFAWYDLWVGVFYDVGRRTVYVCPVPTVLITYRRALTVTKETS